MQNHATTRTSIIRSESAARSRSEVFERLAADGEMIRTLKAAALYLFGSAARDELRDDSDVDVFVDFDPDAKFSLLDQIGLQQHLEQLLGREVDLTTRGGLHPRLRARIERTSLRVL